MTINTNEPQQTLIAKIILSARELDVAMLSKAGVGRNGIAGILDLSTNSVKTLIKRIETKLGSDWLKNSQIIWPHYEEIPQEEQAATSEEPPYAKAERRKQQEKRLIKNRGTALTILIKTSTEGRYVLHVAARQRFWLKPILKELEEQRTIKLLAVDWEDYFAPPWLPLVNKGRKKICSAAYAVNNINHVTGTTRNYLENELEDRLLEINGQLAKVKRAASNQFKDRIPGLSALAAMAIEDFKL